MLESENRLESEVQQEINNPGFTPAPEQLKYLNITSNYYCENVISLF